MSALRSAGAAALALSLAVAASACVTTLNTFPPSGSTPQPPPDSSAGTVATVIELLRRQGLDADIAVRPFRPPEGPLLAAAPRTVIEVVLPDGPKNAWVVVYQLASGAAASSAAADHAAYIEAGIGGGVLFAPGTKFVLQVAGASVVFFSWLPASASDGRPATIAETLLAIGVPVGLVR